MHTILTTLPAPGNVLVVTHRCGSIEFIYGYCRIAYFIQGRIICPEVIRQSGERLSVIQLDPSANGIGIAALQPWMHDGLR
jgi:hypothetical protein